MECSSASDSWSGCLRLASVCLDRAQVHDLYHTLTTPLLESVNRTNLISTRCVSTTLEPHLLYFLNNDNLDPSLYSETATDPPTSPQGNQPSRYLFALVVQDSEMVMADLLTRILEAIAVLGPDNCHLSIVDYGSTDKTGEMLGLLEQFLDQYNLGDMQTRLQRRQEPESTRPQRLSYTFTTIVSKQAVPENSAWVKQLAVRAPFDLNQLSEAVAKVIKDKKEGNGHDGKALQFDEVVILDPVVTCAEDILELIFQRRLQGADLTCGMDIDIQTSPNGEQTIYDSSITRDMLGQRLHKNMESPKEFSTDSETQTRFEKRLPFQVEACWSGGVVVRASSLFSTSFIQSNEQSSLLQQDALCDGSPMDDRSAMCHALWQESTRSEEQVALRVPRMAIVPGVLFSRSPKDYAAQGLFNGWELWPSTEKQYRDQLKGKLAASSHQPMYGYRPSTSSYGYSHESKEDASWIPSFGGKDDDDKGILETLGELVQEQEDLLVIPEETHLRFKTRLEEIEAVFGVQDIQTALQAKGDTEMIIEWRDRTESWEC
ncbi:cryptococcal mannosyltransferase 1-domain-containing protein [Mortierella sp. GBAus27b]|nr:cryptococcal mannosyltransferase 1-domain-containing protein [Mortierella sp. GBAus27b]